MKIDKGFRIMMVMWLLGLGFAGLYVFQNRSCGGDSFCLAVKREDYFKQMTMCMSGALTDLRSMRAGTECLENVTAKIKRDPDYYAVGLP